MTRTRNTVLRTLLALMALGAVLPAGASAQTDSTAVTIPGNPLTVYVGPLGECQSSYLVNGTVAGNYYFGGNQVGDCGFFLAFPKTGAPASVREKTFGFSGAAGPSGLENFKPVKQEPVTGAGTAASPYSQTTIFEVFDTESHQDAVITEVTTYVNGAPQFTSTYTVKNKTASKLNFRAMYAGDLFVNGNDLGTGVFLAGPPRFIGGQNTGSGVIGGFQEVTGAGLLPWTGFQEAYWATATPGEGVSAGDNGIWHDIETAAEEKAKTFNESIETLELDNGAGVEWNQLRTGEGLKAGGEQSFTIINRTQVPTGLQISPVTQTVTAGQKPTITVTSVDTANQPYAGKVLRYTVAGANSQAGAVTLNASGQAQISYTAANAGIDTVQMYVDLPGTASQTPGDPAGSATVTTVPAPPVPNSTYVVSSVKANADGTVTIVFTPTQSGAATLEVTVPTGTISSRNAEAAARKCKRGEVKSKGKCRCKKGQTKIKARCRPTNTVSGRVTLAGVGGVPLKITVKPSSKVKAALKKGRTMHLTATLTYKSALGGAPTVHVFHLTVKPKKRKH